MSSLSSTPYSTGTASIANGSPNLTGATTLWASTIVAGDLFAAQGLVVPIKTVTNNTAIILEYAWPGTTIVAGAYRILKTSTDRYDPSITQAKTRDFLAALVDMTPIYHSIGVPDNGIGEDGQYAIRQDEGTWKLYYKDAGVWGESSVANDGLDAGLLLTFDSDTADADQGGGKVWFNHATLTSATVMYVSKTNRAGSSIAAKLARMDDSTNTVKAEGTVTRASDGAQLSFVIGTVTDATNYVKVAISSVAGPTSFTAADALGLIVERSGDKGTDGVGTGDVLLTATQTLTNKTLTAPVINGSITGTYTLAGTPTFPAAVVQLTTTQTLTNKTLTAPVLGGTITGTYTLGGTPTITAPILSGSITGTYTFAGTPTWPASVVQLTATQTLTNKTLTSPVINSPTGIVKGDVGLGNVDNTSDATERAATATLTNKTLTAPVINGSITGTYTLAGTPTFPAAVVQLTSTQTLTNKTLTSPVINSPTGIVKADVGLGNVDNTSNATERAAAATLTNKTLTAPVINGSITGTYTLGGTPTFPTSVVQVGKQTINIPAGAMRPRVGNGCAALAVFTNALAAVDFPYLAFDATADEIATFGIWMPKSWDEGTLTASFVWSHPATTVNFGVVFGFRARAISNDDAMNFAWSGSQAIADTGGTTDDIYITSETPAFTVEGTAAELDFLIFEVFRLPTNGSDTMAVDARLHAVHIHYTTNTGNDA